MPKKISLFLADEETLFREGLVAICEGSALYRVVGHCGDGRTAFKLIQALKPDIAVLDLGLPKLYALAVIQKALSEESATKFLVLGSRRDGKTVVEVLRSGANGYLLRNEPSSCLFRGLRDILNGSIYVSPQLKLADVFRGRAIPTLGNSYHGLSPREYQVFMMIVQGLRGKEIAARLDLSEKTVSTYRGSLMAKLKIQDLPGLVRYAVRKKLISLR